MVLIVLFYTMYVEIYCLVGSLDIAFRFNLNDDNFIENLTL